MVLFILVNTDYKMICWSKLRSFAEISLLSTTEKKGVSSSFGTPAQISTRDKDRPFKTTLCFLLLRKFSKMLIISLQILFWRSLKISLSCHTLSKALVIPLNIPQTSSPISRSLKISWLNERSWLMQESPEMNQDWFQFILEKKLNIMW